MEENKLTIQQVAEGLWKMTEPHGCSRKMEVTMPRNEDGEIEYTCMASCNYGECKLRFTFTDSFGICACITENRNGRYAFQQEVRSLQSVQKLFEQMMKEVRPAVEMG